MSDDENLDALRYAKPSAPQPEETATPPDPIEPIERLERILAAAKVLASRNSAWNAIEIRMGPSATTANLISVGVYSTSTSVNAALAQATGMTLPQTIEALSALVCERIDRQLKEAQGDRESARKKLSEQEDMVRAFENIQKP